MEKILLAIVTGVGGLATGLLVPWVKDYFAREAERRKYRRDLIERWRAFITAQSQLLESFGDTAEYASLRSHMLPSVIAKFEAPRTMYVPGARGVDVRRQMLLDEITRIEKLWKLV